MILPEEKVFCAYGHHVHDDDIIHNVHNVVCNVYVHAKILHVHYVQDNHVACTCIRGTQFSVSRPPQLSAKIYAPGAKCGMCVGLLSSYFFAI